MPNPRINVLGIYRLKITTELIREQCENLYPDAAEEWEIRDSVQKCLEQLQSVVLIEVLVENRDSKFRMRDFTQAKKGVRRDSWQAAWQEVFLTTNGKSLLKTDWPSLPELQTFRVAFYLHFYESGEPLLSSYGPLDCPPKKTMPKRLQQLAPFIPTD